MKTETTVVVKQILSWPRRHSGLASVFGFLAVGHLLDVHSTAVALETGAQELNPTVKSLLEAGGIGYFFLFKAVLVGLVYLLVGGLLFLSLRPIMPGAFMALAGAPAWLISGSNYNEAGLLP